MNEFQFLILNSHQVFFALVICAFAFFLVADLNKGTGMLGLEQRRTLGMVLMALTAGVFAILYDAWDEKGIFFAFEFSLLVTCSLIHPKYAISFLVYLLLSRPWETYDNQMMSSMPREISYLCGLSLVAHKIFKKEYYFRFNTGTFLLLAFSVWMFMSGFLSHHADEAIREYVEIFIKGIILFLLIQNGLEKSEDMLPVKTVFVLAILEKCFVSYYKSNIMHIPTLLEDANERLESVGILSNSNDIAAIFVLAVPFTLFFILKSNLRPFNWLLAGVTLVIMSYLIWESQSRGALLGLFAVFGAYAFIKIKSKKMIAMALTATILGVFGAFALLQRDAADIEGSTSNRILYWKAGLNMAMHNPVLGVGFWGFPKNLPAYAPSGNVGTEKEHMTAHSSWVLALAEGGFAALAFFGGLWVYAAFAAWKIRLTQPEYLLGVAGYGICISFLSHTYLLYPYILLALVITHYQIERRPLTTRG